VQNSSHLTTNDIKALTAPSYEYNTLNTAHHNVNQFTLMMTSYVGQTSKHKESKSLEAITRPIKKYDTIDNIQDSVAVPGIKLASTSIMGHSI